MKKIRKIQNEKGQAIIEFLLFLPFLLMMYSVTLSISNAINASINQQKVARSYFYYKLLNNSTFPAAERVGNDTESWRVFGSEIMGWSEFLFNNRNPVAPCFKFHIPIEGTSRESCDESYSSNVTKYIRVQTVYGVCGATYLKDSGQNVMFPKASFSPNGADIKHCIIIE